MCFVLLHFLVRNQSQIAQEYFFDLKIMILCFSQYLLVVNQHIWMLSTILILINFWRIPYSYNGIKQVQFFTLCIQLVVKHNINQFVIRNFLIIAVKLFNLLRFVRYFHPFIAIEFGCVCVSIFCRSTYIAYCSEFCKVSNDFFQRNSSACYVKKEKQKLYIHTIDFNVIL